MNRMNENRNMDKNDDPAINFGNNNSPSDCGVYRCKKCGGETNSIEMETRLPDIPKDIFLLCKVCGNAWKI